MIHSKPRTCLLLMPLVLAFAGCAFPTGLLRSRWAMSDPTYAEKYEVGAEKGDFLGKLKQASDARFQSGAQGLYVSTGVAQRGDGDGGLFLMDIGAEKYLDGYSTARASLMGMINSEDWFTGLDAGLRLQTPSRLAPFVGAGFFAGAARETVDASDDWIDNDEDGFIDEWGEDKTRIKGALAAIYPETGAHFWWTPNLRLTGYGRYMVTTEGRDADDWLIGFGLAAFSK